MAFKLGSGSQKAWVEVQEARGSLEAALYLVRFGHVKKCLCADIWVDRPFNTYHHATINNRFHSHELALLIRIE